MALLPTFAVAVDVAVWFAELGPELTSPPAIETGTFAFTAFWSLFATPIAPWWVSAFCTPAWNPPAPPQPMTQESLPPTSCCCDWPWLVVALLLTFVVAEELAVCVAELGPELTSPPAIETGTFALTAF